MITEDDCGTSQGYNMKALVEGGEVIEPLRDRILGRVAAIDLSLIHIWHYQNFWSSEKWHLTKLKSLTPSLA